MHNTQASKQASARTQKEREKNVICRQWLFLIRELIWKECFHRTSGRPRLCFSSQSILNRVIKGMLKRCNSTKHSYSRQKIQPKSDQLYSFGKLVWKQHYKQGTIMKLRKIAKTSKQQMFRTETLIYLQLMSQTQMIFQIAFSESQLG